MCNYYHIRNTRFGAYSYAEGLRLLLSTSPGSLSPSWTSDAWNFLPEFSPVRAQA